MLGSLHSLERRRTDIVQKIAELGDLRAGSIDPADAVGAEVERVDVAVPGAKVVDALPRDRRGLDRGADPAMPEKPPVPSVSGPTPSFAG